MCVSCRMDFFDEVTQEESSVDEEEGVPYMPTDVATKVLHLDGVSLEVDSRLASPEVDGEWLYPHHSE